MRFRLFTLVIAGVLCAPALGAALSDGTPTDPRKDPAHSPEQSRRAVERGLTFIELDAVKWRKERGCTTCHHGMLTVWALNEAKAQGYPVNEPALAEFTFWAKNGSIPSLDQQQDPRPGWSLVSQRAVYLAMASHDLPILSRDEVRRVAVHLARHQQADGAYEIPPHSNAPPPVFFESREVVALFSLLAWEPYVAADPAETAVNRARREKTLAWLRKNPSTDTTQALALRLLVDVRSGTRGPQLEARLTRLLQRQGSDGGWGQEKGLESDAYATGQALYALGHAGVKQESRQIQRAIAFLVSTQREDGSWGVTPRNYPEVDWKRTGLAMNYFGTAWAQLGLLRYVPSPPDTPAKRQNAFDMVRGYHGKFEVDESLPDRPVVRVDLRYYDLDDRALQSFARVLQAFPRLQVLQLKSTKITDAGLAHLKGLPHLRSLAIENAPITDTGLAHLSMLGELKMLTLKGTMATEAGVLKLRKALPTLQVER